MDVTDVAVVLVVVEVEGLLVVEVIDVVVVVGLPLLRQFHKPLWQSRVSGTKGKHNCTSSSTHGPDVPKIHCSQSAEDSAVFVLDVVVMKVGTVTDVAVVPVVCVDVDVTEDIDVAVIAVEEVTLETVVTVLAAVAVVSVVVGGGSAHL